jgi:putative phage-type endonuclease
MPLIFEVKKILDNNTNIHPIRHDMIDSVVSWLYETIKFYYFDEPYELIDVENIYLSMATKVIYIDSKNKPIVHIDYYKEKKRCVKKNKFLDKKLKLMANTLNYLMNLPQPAQRTLQWYVARDRIITASDGATAMGEDHHRHVFQFIMKKLNLEPPFEECDATFHGKKYETIANLIYEYRNDVQVLEFGLLLHPTIDILGASPDGICNIISRNGKKFVVIGGRMVEIKCPVSREIKSEGKIDGEQCPHGYWIQVQLQLECCDLEECDFWQCKLEEYKSRDSYLKDTAKQNPLVSNETQLERGCFLQFMPTDRTDFKNEYEGKFKYPPQVNMTIHELDAWVLANKESFEEDDKTYVFDRIVWWRLGKAACCLIKRDKVWFKSALLKLQKTWSYVVYFRNNEDKKNLWNEYITKQRFRRNKEIMEIADKLMNDNKRGSYAQRLKDELSKIDINKLPKKQPKVFLKSTNDIDFSNMLNNDDSD